MPYVNPFVSLRFSSWCFVDNSYNVGFNSARKASVRLDLEFHHRIRSKRIQPGIDDADQVNGHSQKKDGEQKRLQVDRGKDEVDAEGERCGDKYTDGGKIADVGVSHHAGPASELPNLAKHALQPLVVISAERRLRRALRKPALFFIQQSNAVEDQRILVADRQQQQPRGIDHHCGSEDELDDLRYGELFVHAKCTRKDERQGAKSAKSAKNDFMFIGLLLSRPASLFSALA